MKNFLSNFNTTWAQERAKQILADAKDRYGPAWALMSEDQRSNFVDSRVLMLLLAQSGEKFEPAVTMASEVLQAMRTKKP